MQVLRTISALRAWRQAHKAQQHTIGLVPTMGYLHEGHLSLFRRARPEANALIASIFVNPKQFGPREDLAGYPRDEAGDLEKLVSVGTDAVFIPTSTEMYPPGFSTQVRVSGLTEVLCGRSRPTHFSGVTTVVCRLFNLVGADRAYFGLKDYQQFRVVSSMVRDLALEVQVVGVPTCREPDGLAMSSRNAYLTSRGRKAAPVLYAALKATARCYDEGERNPEVLKEEARRRLEAEPLGTIDYVEVLDAVGLDAPRPDQPMLLAVAYQLDGARLIDNTVLGSDINPLQ